jgi:ubiquinol-cytochrome c reductase core subunit 2
MASRIARTPLVQVQRQLATKASPAAIKKQTASEAIETSTLSSGLTVASLSLPSSAISTFGVVVKAGARYEGHDNLGVGHAIRIAAGLATKNSTSFAVVRNLQQVGAGLNCYQGREYMLYTTQMTRDKVDSAIDFFFDTIAQPAFKPWELSDNKGRMALEVAELSNEAKATELLHQAAYRTGLGNSIYSPVHMIGKHKPAMVESFHAKHYTGNRAALVGVGIEHSHLLKYADILKLQKGGGPDSSSKYFGGELRHDCGGGQAVVIVAAETAGLSNPREAVACKLLQHILGTGPRVHYGQGMGQLQRAVSGKVGSDVNFAVSSINYGYADSGLLGAFIICDAAAAGKVVETAAAALRSANVTEAELKAAKKALSLEVGESSIQVSDLVREVGVSALLRSGHPLSDMDKQDLVAQATLADVQAAAKKLASSKLTMSAVGNLATVPYLDAL